MKALIIYILLLFPLLTMAQKDSVNISYSEEKVENFEKTTLIDEYEKAFGNNRVVKSAFRISLTGFGLPSRLLSSQVRFPIRDFIRDLDPILQFEQKVSNDKSLIASFSGNRHKQYLFWNANIGLEGRWYYEMKKRVADGKQQPNITGKYLSLKIVASPYRYNRIYRNLYDFGAGSLVFRSTSAYGLNWGWQLGNNVNYWLSAGIAHGDRASVDNKGFWIDGTLSGKKATTWFVSSNAQAGLGLFLPLKKRTANNSCDFLQCNYEVKQLFKVNLNNMLYMDRYFQKLNLDIAYERKIGRSPLSINSNIKAELSNRFIHAPMGYKIDSIINNAGIPMGTGSRQTFSTELHNYPAYSFEIEEQLRYYIGMKNRIVKGKSASNLNGLYVGILGSYRLQNQWFPSVDMDNVPHVVGNPTKELSGGVSIGYQIQTNRRSFLDISTSILRQRVAHPVYYPNPGQGTTINSIISFSLKLGFAK